MDIPTCIICNKPFEFDNNDLAKCGNVEIDGMYYACCIEHNSIMLSGEWKTIDPKTLNAKPLKDTTKDSIEVLTPGIGIKIKKP